MAWSAPTEWERWNPEQLLECPYDSIHRIPAKRYQYHVIKCRKQHPEKDFVSCPFNAKHIMLRPELRKHITKCPEKSEVEPYSYKGSERDSDGFYFKGDTSVPSYRKEELSIQPVYEWDREDDVTIVNQYQYSAQQQPLVIQPSRNNQAVQDGLSLKPEDRDQFKNTLRSRALQNDLESPHYQTATMNCDYAPKTTLDNRPRIVCQKESNNMLNNGHAIHTNNSPRLLSHDGMQNNQHSLRHYGGLSSSNTCQGEPQRPLTFRGLGRARLAEEARRTQFGVNSNIYSGIQTPGFTVGRGRGILGFSEADIKRA